MALDPNSAAGQLDGIYTKLAAFYTAAANHVSNTSGSVAPASSSDLESMAFDSAVSLAVSSTEQGGSRRVGAMIEAAHLAQAIQREISMAAMTRISLYQAAAGDLSTDAALMTQVGASEVSTFNSGGYI